MTVMQSMGNDKNILIFRQCNIGVQERALASIVYVWFYPQIRNEDLIIECLYFTYERYN